MMSAAQQAQSASTWTEPPWSGWIETTGDALLILEAARQGLIPRVTRRLVDSERKMITSGSVFVFDEEESGIKRWTDGFYWSPSRILGNFLLYRETDKRGAGHKAARAEQEAQDAAAAAAATATYTADGAQTLSRPKTDNTGLNVDKQRERTLMGSLTNSYKFKPDGLMKKTFSVTIGGVAQHLISYYKIEDVENGRLRSPSSLPELASLDISPEYLDKTHFRNPPKVETGVDGIPRYRGEADDIENSPSILSAPLSSGMPLLTEGRLTDNSMSRRGKRPDYPSNSPPASKRARRNTGASGGGSNAVSSGNADGGSSSNGSTPTADPVSPQESASSSTPQPAAAVTPHITSVQPMPPVSYAPPPYGVQFFPLPGYQPHPSHALGPPPPPGMYASPPAPTGYNPGGARTAVPTGATGMHYTYTPYPPPNVASAPPTSQQEGGAGVNQQQQVHAHAHAQVPAPPPQPVQARTQVQQASTQAPLQQIHRTDPSQSTPAALPAPGQAQLPQPYYGYYHHPHGPPPPGVGGMHPSAMAPMIQGVQYPPYTPWPMYSGFPPQPPPQVMHYAPQQVDQQQQQQQPLQPAQKREDGLPGGSGA